MTQRSETTETTTSSSRVAPMGPRTRESYGKPTEEGKVASYRGATNFIMPKAISPMTYEPDFQTVFSAVFGLKKDFTEYVDPNTGLLVLPAPTARTT